MKLEVLGTGCQKCSKLYDAVKEAAKEAGIDAQIVKVEDLGEIMKHRVLMTPALVIDGKVAFSGKIPTGEELKKMIAG
ncbi:thioredoxin family protein [bacterium]|nr:MAG: thioredoxin family protein [bacterium]